MAGYDSFDVLAVADDAELRDPRRIRRLCRARYGRVFLAAGVVLTLSAAVGACVLWAAWSAWTRTGALRDAPWTPIIVVGLLAAIAALMQLAFVMEAAASPLRGYARDRARFEFARGELRQAHAMSADGRGSSRARVWGAFAAPDGREIPLIEEFDAGLWSDHFERGRGRIRLPLPVWVLYRREPPHIGCMVGIPREIVGSAAKDES